MRLEIITPSVSNIYNIKSLHFSSKEDSFSILENHAPFIKTMDHGNIRTKGDTEINIFINKAIIKVINNSISVIEL
ncbi:MAG: hypothetical protein ACQPRJ_05165 [Solitalea-like symbiont of Acarus siro]